MHQQHEDAEGNANAQPSPPDKEKGAFPIIRGWHEISGEQKHQAHAKCRICGIKWSEPAALCAIVHGPKTASGPVGLGGVVDNDENNGRDTQRVDEDQPPLVFLVRQTGLLSHAAPVSPERKLLFYRLIEKASLMPIK